MELSQLIAAIGVSVQQAQSRVERTAVEEYLGYFRSHGEGETMEPQTVEVALPGEDGTPEPMPVPVVALVNHSPLRLEQVRVRLSITPALEGENEVQVSAAPAGEGSHSLELLFQAGEAGEAASRISNAASKVL